MSVKALLNADFNNNNNFFHLPIESSNKCFKPVYLINYSFISWTYLMKCSNIVKQIIWSVILDRYTLGVSSCKVSIYSRAVDFLLVHISQPADGKQF